MATILSYNLKWIGMTTQLNKENNLVAMPEYYEILKHYHKRTAARSGVPLMNHIHEGLAVIQALSTVMEYDMFNAQRAYCIHPLVQSNEMFLENADWLVNSGIPSSSVLYAIEYRNRANEWLSDKVDKNGKTGEPTGGPLNEVWAMLCADKVQNYKDFQQYHSDHPRHEELTRYFKEWLYVLGIRDEIYQSLLPVMEAANVR